MTSRSKKRLAALTVLAFAVVLVLAAIEFRSRFRARSLARELELGMAAYSRGDYPDGMQHLSRYVGHVKTNSGATLALADCRRRIPEENRRHLVTALAYVRAAVQAAPGDPRPLEMMLEICDECGYATEATESADRLLAIDPSHLGALKARTRALASLGRNEEALRAALDMAQKHPEFVGAHDAVVQFMQTLQRSPGEIRGYAERVVAQRSRNGPSLEFALFECRVAILTRGSASKDDDLSIRAAVRRAAAMPIRSREELSELLRCIDLLHLPGDQGNTPAPLSEEVLARAAAEPTIAREAALLKTERAWKAGNVQMTGERSAGLSPPLSKVSDRELGLRDIMLSSNVGDGPVAHDAIRAELARRATDEAKYWSRVLAGREALGANDLQRSVSELSAAAKQVPSEGFAQYFLGEAFSRREEWQAAAEQFAAAARTDPVWRTARIASIRLLADNGRFAEARAQAAEGLAIHNLESDAVLYADVSVCMIEARRATDTTAAEINRELDEFHRRRAGVPAIEALRARGLLAVGRLDDARRVAADLLALPGTPPQESLIRLAIGLRPHDPALADRLDELSSKAPGAVTDSVAVRATLLTRAGQLDQAKVWLRSAAAQSTGADSKRLTLLLGLVMDMGRDPDAKKLLAALADANPSELSYQLAVLRSSFAWGDESTVKRTLSRVGAILGQESAPWRLYEARRLLRFSPSPENAARVISSDREGLNLVQVVRDDPADPEAAVVLAEAYLMSKDKDGIGDNDSAISTLARAVDADPANPAAYPRLIELLQRTGRPADAAQRLSGFLRIQDLPLSIQRQRAKLLRAQGMLPEYAKELRDLSSRGHAEDRLALARERAATGDIAQAGRLFDTLLAEERPSADAVVAAAEFFTARDGFEAGQRVLSRLPPDCSARDRKKREARLNNQCGRYEQAERLLKELAADNSAPAWADLAEFYLLQKRTDEAGHAVQRGLALAPEDTRLLWLSGTIRMNSGKDNTAAFLDLAKAATATDVGPGTRAIVEAFRAHGTRSEEPGLMGALKTVTRRYPTSLQAWLLLVAMQRKAGLWEEAANSALSAAQMLPADPRAARLATETLAEAHRLTEAETMAGRWRELAPENAMTVDIVRARLMCIRGQVVDALKLLDAYKTRIAAGAEERPEDLKVYASALAAGGRIGEARQLLGDRVQTAPEWGVRYLQVAGALVSRPEDARMWLRGLRIADDAPADLICAAAQAWFAVGSGAGARRDDLDESARYARRLTGIPGREGEGFSLLGAIFMTRGEENLAIEAYRAAATKLPDDVEALNNLAYLLELRADGSFEAQVLAKRALELATRQRLPGSTRAHILETLGVAELNLGSLDAAEGVFRAGLAIDRNSIELSVGLAEALLELKRPQEAARVVDRIGALVPNAATLSPALSARLNSVRGRLAAKR